MENAPVGFSGSKEISITEESSIGGVAAATREQSEIQSAIIVAKKFPRNEQASYAKVMNSLTRITLAEKAAYNFPRGGSNITGPSIKLAREIARCWENVRYGIRIVKESQEKICIKGYAYDCEANTYVEAEDEFKKLIQRKDKKTGITGWVTPDERDLRELINRKGALLVRNCILQILPPDIIEDALSQARKTVDLSVRKELSTNREDAIKRSVLAFSNLGVPVALIEKKLEKKSSDWNKDDIVTLKGIYTSVQEGHTKVSEHFDFADTVTGAQVDATSDISAKLKADTDKLKEKDVPVQAEEPKRKQVGKQEPNI